MIRIKNMKSIPGRKKNMKNTSWGEQHTSKEGSKGRYKHQSGINQAKDQKIQKKWISERPAGETFILDDFVMSFWQLHSELKVSLCLYDKMKMKVS